MKIGTFVDIDFGVSGKVSAAEIVAVKETQSTVLFDVDIVTVYAPDKKHRTRLHGVYSGLCKERTPEYLERSTNGTQNAVIAIEALEHISNPIKHFQEQAEKDGNRIDGQMALSLAKDPSYLQDVARKAIALINTMEI